MLSESGAWILALIRSEAMPKSAKALTAMDPQFDKTAPGLVARSLIGRMRAFRMIQLQVRYVALWHRSLVELIDRNVLLFRWRSLLLGCLSAFSVDRGEVPPAQRVVYIFR